MNHSMTSQLSVLPTTTKHVDLDLDLDLNNAFPSKDLLIFRNLSEEERLRYLVELQEETTRILLPVIIFLAVLTTVGLFGNSMVLLVYSKKASHGATDLFIMVIASFDLMASMLALPGELYRSFHYWDFDKPWLCKFQRFFNTLTTITPGMILLAVAVSRYKKICRPFGNQISLKKAKIVSISIVLFGLLIATPQFILSGTHTIPTQRVNITAHECDTNDQFSDTMWYSLYYLFFMLLFIGASIPLVVIYVLIGIQAWRHSKRHGIPNATKALYTSNEMSTRSMKSEDTHRRRSKYYNSGFGLLRRNKQTYDITSSKSTHEEHLESDVFLEMTNAKKNSKEECSRKDEESNDERSATASEVESHCPNKVRPSFNDVNSSKATCVMADGSSLSLKIINGTDANNGSEHNENKSKNKSETKEANNQKSFYDESSINDRKPKKGEEIPREEIMRQRLQDPLTVKVKTENRTNTNENDDVGVDNSNTATRNVYGVNNRETSDRIYYPGPNDVSRKESQPKISDKFSTLSLKRKLIKGNTTHYPAQRRVLTRTTFTLIVITAVFLLAFVPHLTLAVCMSRISNFIQNLSSVEKSIHYVFWKFYFLNSATNAIIYGFCNDRFRKNMFKIISSCRK